MVAYLDAGAEDKVKEIVEVTYSSVYFMLKNYSGIRYNIFRKYCIHKKHFKLYKHTARLDQGD